MKQLSISPKPISNTPKPPNISPRQVDLNTKTPTQIKPKIQKRVKSKSIGGEKKTEEGKVNWQKDMEQLTKEEMIIKKSLNQLDMKFKSIKTKSTKIQSPTKNVMVDKEQKEIQKSLLQIDALLKRISNKYNEKPTKKMNDKKVNKKL